MPIAIPMNNDAQRTRTIVNSTVVPSIPEAPIPAIATQASVGVGAISGKVTLVTAKNPNTSTQSHFTNAITGNRTVSTTNDVPRKPPPPSVVTTSPMQKH